MNETDERTAGKIVLSFWVGGHDGTPDRAYPGRPSRREP
jgi:hypothetical protein